MKRIIFYITLSILPYFVPNAHSIWLSVDPMADKYPNISPYAYCNWNPVKYVDPDGTDVYIFAANGEFTGKIVKQKGEHIGRILYSNNNSLDFSFNDLADAERICLPNTDKYDSFNNQIDNNAITYVSLIEYNQIKNLLPETTTTLNGISYALEESRGGKLDFVNQATSILQQDATSIFLPNDGKNIAYNHFDFGNYLWGLSMKKLNIPLLISRLGAHLDNILNHKGELDSPEDQQAIMNGYNSIWLK